MFMSSLCTTRRPYEGRAGHKRPYIANTGDSLLLALSSAFLFLTRWAAVAQEIGLDICACQPSVYEITLNFDLTCADQNVGGRGITDTTCLTELRGQENQEDSDLRPVAVGQVSIFELDQNIEPVAQTVITGNYISGSVIRYTSIISTEPQSITSESLPRGIQVVFIGINQLNQAVVNTFAILYDNDCGVFPLLRVGQRAGWGIFTDLGIPPIQVCPIAGIQTPQPTDPSLTSPPSPFPTPAGTELETLEGTETVFPSESETPISQSPTSPDLPIPTCPPVIPGKGKGKGKGGSEPMSLKGMTEGKGKGGYSMSLKDLGTGKGNDSSDKGYKSKKSGKGSMSTKTDGKGGKGESAGLSSGKGKGGQSKEINKKSMKYPSDEGRPKVSGGSYYDGSMTDKLQRNNLARLLKVGERPTPTPTLECIDPEFPPEIGKGKGKGSAKWGHKGKGKGKIAKNEGKGSSSKSSGKGKGTDSSASGKGKLESTNEGMETGKGSSSKMSKGKGESSSKKGKGKGGSAKNGGIGIGADENSEHDGKGKGKGQSSMSNGKGGGGASSENYGKGESVDGDSGRKGKGKGQDYRTDSKGKGRSSEGEGKGNGTGKDKGDRSSGKDSDVKNDTTGATSTKSEGGLISHDDLYSRMQELSLVALNFQGSVSENSQNGEASS